MKRIYMATSDAHSDEADQRPHHFASIDGESWTEITEPWPLTADHYDELKAEFEPKVHADGSRTLTIKLARRYLTVWCQNVVFAEPLEVA